MSSVIEKVNIFVIVLHNYVKSGSAMSSLYLQYFAYWTWSTLQTVNTLKFVDHFNFLKIPLSHFDIVFVSGEFTIIK